MTEQDIFLRRLQKKQDERTQKMKRIMNAGATQHSHAEMDSWLTCFHCMLANRERLREQQKLGLAGGTHMKFLKRKAETDRLIRTVQNLRYGAKLHL